MSTLRSITVSSVRVHNWYSDAMCTRRNGSQLTREGFLAHVSQPQVLAWGDIKMGFIFGEMRKGIFCPSHFAPKSKRAGVALIKSLISSEHEVLFAVPDDLGIMLRKMSGIYHLNSIQFPVCFRNTVCIKSIYTNCGLVLDRAHKLHKRYSK